MKWIYITYLLISALLMFGVLIYLWKKPHHNEIETPMKMLFFFGGMAVASNAAAMVVSSQLESYIFFGLYYVMVDLMVLGVMAFVRRYTNIRDYDIRLQSGLSIAIDLDAILMIANCFKHFVFKCEQVTDRTGALFWAITGRGFAYYYHVLVSCGIGILIISDLLRKIHKASKIYKSKYAIILILCCVILGVHSIYLQFDFKIDYALMWVAIIAYAMFYFSMFYVPRGLLDRLMFFTISNMENGIICLDNANHCIHANKNAKAFCDGKMDDQVRTWLDEVKTLEEDSTIWKIKKTVDETVRHYEIEYKRMFDDENKGIGCFFMIHDCTEEINRLLSEQFRATHDELTNIYNKEYFYKKVKNLLEQNPDVQYCIVCTDVKNFKIINDVFGVETGDKLLIRIASAISFMARDGWLYGRLTGDRFAVCLPKEEFSEEEFLREASKVSRLSENYIFKIQIHIGVYNIEDRSLRVSVMCDRANLAIKTIKESYQSSVSYYKENLREDFLNEQRIISEFDLAIRSGQFHAFVQPQVFSKNGKIHGGEVLVRWIHPQTGMIPPYKFIPIFEQTGLIGKLDVYMWELACQKLQEWQRKGLMEHYLSVNISQKDFYLLDVYEVMTSLVKKYQIQPQNLHLEITETAIMNNPQEQLPLISRLREYGFIMEIDDFGSGYSSLNTLKDLNADVLKIDMGFLRKTEHQERSKIILKMIVSLAKALDMEVITEGVETKEQVDFLKEYGCDIFQGYHFAKPMPIRDFEVGYLNKTVEV